MKLASSKDTTKPSGKNDVDKYAMDKKADVNQYRMSEDRRYQSCRCMGNADDSSCAGVEGTKEAQDIVPKVAAKIREYQEAGDQIIFTRDTHGEDYLETPEGKKLPVEHCIKGTKGWMIADGLEVDGAEYIDKPNFGWSHWNEWTFDEIEMVGLCTDICVVSNALILKAEFPEVKITVDASCCAGVTPESHEAALLTMKMCQIDVINE